MGTDDVLISSIASCMFINIFKKVFMASLAVAYVVRNKVSFWISAL